MPHNVVPIGPHAFLAAYRGERIAVGDTAAEALRACCLTAGCDDRHVTITAVPREWPPENLIESVYTIMTRSDDMLLMSDTVTAALRAGRVRDALTLLPGERRIHPKVLYIDAWRRGERPTVAPDPPASTQSSEVATAIREQWADWCFVNHVPGDESPADVGFLGAD